MSRHARVFRFLLVLAAAVIAIVPGGAQTDQPPPGRAPVDVGFVEKTVVAVAQLEILATDADGAAVDDLLPSEVRVFENGVEQKLAFLERVSVGRAGLAGPATEKPAALFSGSGVHPAGELLDVLPTAEVRRVVLVFDVRNSKKSVRKRWVEAARTWLVEGMQPEDRVGIVVFGTYPEWIVEFTDDRAALLQGIDRASLNKKAAGRDRRREMSRLNDDIRQCIEIERGRRASGDAVDCAMHASRSHVQQWHRVSEESAQNLRSLVGQLAAIPGRKAALMFSEGIVDDASMLAVYAMIQNFGSADGNWDPYKTKYRLLNRDVIRAMDEVRRVAREAGVSFFTLDTREGTSAGFGGNLEHAGVQPVFAQGVNPWTEMRETTARTLEVLARETGGRAYHGVDDLESDLRSAADSFFGIYTVGYYRSVPESKPGKVRLEVGRPGVEIDYRDQAEVRGGRSRVARMELEIGRPERHGSAGEQTLPVRLSIDFDDLPLRKAGKSRGTVLGLHLQAIRPDGSLSAERLDIEVVAVDGKQGAERSGSRYVHQTELILPPGPYRIRARLSDDRQELVADRAIDLTLEPGLVHPGLR